jgi:DNA invertase Pin-like site-specific DNA recombinase
VRAQGRDPSVVAYLRVSSRSQSVQTQRDAIERVARARGERIDRWFEEKRTGKALTNRPVLAALRDEIRRGAVGILYVYRLDRLTRSGIRDTFEVVEEFRARRVQIVTVADGFVVDGPAADVVLAVLAWAAQMERLAIGERIADAHQRVTAAGGAWGRPRRVDRQTADRLLADHASGRSVRQIAIAYKVPRSTVARIVSQKPTATDHSPRPVKKARDQGMVR